MGGVGSSGLNIAFKVGFMVGDKEGVVWGCAGDGDRDWFRSVGKQTPAKVAPRGPRHLCVRSRGRLPDRKQWLYSPSGESAPSLTGARASYVGIRIAASGCVFRAPVSGEDRQRELSEEKIEDR